MRRVMRAGGGEFVNQFCSVAGAKGTTNTKWLHERP